MKKLLSILLILMLAFAFVSCGDDEEPEIPAEDIIPGFGEGVEGPIIPYE